MVTDISGRQISSPVPESGRSKIVLGRLYACEVDVECREPRRLALHRLKQHAPADLCLQIIGHFIQRMLFNITDTALVVLTLCACVSVISMLLNHRC